MIYFRLKYILSILIVIIYDCASEIVNQENLQLKFVFIVSIYRMKTRSHPTKN